TAEERRQKKEDYKIIQDLVGMPQKVRDAQFRFMEIDWKMMDDWSGKGVSYALDTMVKDGEEYAKKVFEKDAEGNPDGTGYNERRGSHSLVAKDEPHKQPDYEEAMTLAKCVGKYISETMVREVTQNAAPVARASDSAPNDNVLTINQWVDWLEL